MQNTRKQSKLYSERDINIEMSYISGLLHIKVTQVIDQEKAKHPEQYLQDRAIVLLGEGKDISDLVEKLENIPSRNPDIFRFLDRHRQLSLQEVLNIFRNSPDQFEQFIAYRILNDRKKPDSYQIITEGILANNELIFGSAGLDIQSYKVEISQDPRREEILLMIVEKVADTIPTDSMKAFDWRIHMIDVVGLLGKKQDEALLQRLELIKAKGLKRRGFLDRLIFADGKSEASLAIKSISKRG